MRSVVLLALVLTSFTRGQTGVAIVRNAPTLNGTIEGSVQQLLGQNIALSGSTSITGDLLVPGTPAIRVNGKPTYAGTVDGAGATAPSNYEITLSGNVMLRHVVRRTDAILLTKTPAPPRPIGTRNVTLNSAAQSAGDFATVQNLTLNGNAGQVNIPPGVYGDFAANGNSGFTVGIVGATRPALYSFQRFTLNGATELRVVGPVIVSIAGNFDGNGNAGSSDHPAWLTMNIADGSVTINGNAKFFGYLNASSGTVDISGNSQLIGGLVCDRLTLNGAATLRLLAPVNKAPEVSLLAPPNGATYVAPASLILQASAVDPDGVIARVEFFRDSARLGEITTAPYQFAVTNLPAGNYGFTARATDDSGAITDSSPVTITVKGNLPPVVNFTAPVNGAAFTAPAAITLVANASDADGVIARVEFYQGSVKIADDLAAPFETALTGMPTGSYSFTARAVDNGGASTASTPISVTVRPPNQLPVVTLTSPPSGAVVLAPATFTLVAGATDSDGTITRVEFFRGETKIGERATPPYEIAVVDLAAGSYDFSARATDDGGGAVNSAALRLTVNQPPAVTIMSPAPGATFTAPAAFILTAAATDVDGTITRVEFFESGVRLGEIVRAPYEFPVANLAAGDHAFSARAFDDLGARAVSPVLTVTVTAPNFAPTVALTAPADGAVFTAPATIMFNASATDSDGTVTKVEFFQGAAKLGEALVAPFNFTWSNVAPGNYSVTARAEDNIGASTTSAPRVVTVQVGLPYFTGFEPTDGYAKGPLSAQVGWTAIGGVNIIDSLSNRGAQSVSLAGSVPPAQAVHRFPAYSGQTIAFIDLFARPAVGLGAAESMFAQADGARVACVRDGDLGEFYVFDGNGNGGGIWKSTGAKTALTADGQCASWTRVTLREDFTAKRWDFWINARLAAYDLGFADAAGAGFSTLTLVGHPTATSLFDDFFAGFDNPLYLDADKDGMDDGWESRHGLNVASNDRNGDPDGDGLPNIREYQLGTDPQLADTDGDGLPDGWEVQMGLDPLAAISGTHDSDGDGLPDLQEYILGTHPFKADTDGDGMPDGWEIAHGFDPKNASDGAQDRDGDGWTNAEEFRNATDPDDYFNGVLPELVSLLPANQQPASDGAIGVLVARADGSQLKNAPIAFAAISGGLLLSDSVATATPVGTVDVRSNLQGIATAFVKYPLQPAITSVVSVMARSGSQVRVISMSIGSPYVDTDADGLPDTWEIRYLGSLEYGANDDPGGIGRTITQSWQQNANPWPAATVGNGLQAWYRGDRGITKDSASRISRWADLSGNGVHVSQANAGLQPLATTASVGMKPGVHFDGSSMSLRSSGVDLFRGSSDVTVIVIVQPGAAQSTYADILDYDHTTAPYGGFVLQQNENALNQYGLGWRNTNNQTWEGLTPTVSLKSGAPHLLSIVKSGTTQSAYVNGEPRFTATVPAEMLGNPPRFIGLGKVAATATERYFNGDIAEILIYNRALTSAERAEVEAWLMDRYLDTDSDGLADPWELRQFGTLANGPTDDPGSVGRTLADSYFNNRSPWPEPTVASGLQLWYRADLGVTKDTSNRVSRWLDLSGNGVHALQSSVAAQPVLLSAAFGAQPALHFDGSVSMLRSDLADLLKGSNDLSVVVAVKVASSQATYADIVDYSHGLPPYGGFVVQQNVNALNQYGMGWWSVSNGGWAGLSPTATLTAGAVQLFAVIKAAGQQTGYVNGEQRFTAAVPTLLAANPPRAFCVGSFGASSERFFKGDIAEVLVYNRALSALECGQIEAALTAKYLNPDNDGNQIADIWEMTYFGQIGIDPQADPDGDALTNLQEFKLGTNPLAADSDGDGIADGVEVALGLVPLRSDGDADPDGDGISNRLESLLGSRPDRAALPDTTGIINLRLYQPHQ